LFAYLQHNLCYLSHHVFNVETEGNKQMCDFSLMLFENIHQDWVGKKLAKKECLIKKKQLVGSGVYLLEYGRVSFVK